MNSLTNTFHYNSVVVRTAGTAEEPLFCLRDICTVLGVQRTGDVSSALADKFKCVVLIDTKKGKRDMVCVTEAGLYKVLIRTRKSKIADKFQDWLCEDVLPSIRKTGKYEREQLKLEQSHADNEKLRLTMGIKRLEIEEQKVQNQSLIRKKEQLQTENYQLQNLQAIPLIYQIKGIREPSKSEYNAAKKLVKQLGRRYIEWKNRKPYFLNQHRVEEATPRIRRARFHVPRWEMTDSWKVANNKYGFK